MNTKNYSDKLKDPRWQKKRLEIMGRDDFTCRFCSDTTRTLNVHHLSYSTEPWEVPSDHLITLCESCHEGEHVFRKEAEQNLLLKLKLAGFNSTQIEELSEGFSSLQIVHVMDVMASVIRHALTNKNIMGQLTDLYFKFQEEKYYKEHGDAGPF